MFDRSLLDRQADEILELERLAADQAGARLRTLLQGISRDLVIQWAFQVGLQDQSPSELTEVGLRVWLIERFGALVNLAPDLTQFAQQSLRLGMTHAIAQADDAIPFINLKIPDDLARMLDTRRAVADAVALAGIVAGSGPLTFSLATNAVGVASQAVSRVELAARTVVNRGVAAGTDQAATAAGYDKLWRAERDGCVHCMAYSGKIDRGGGFPGGLTFGDKPIQTEPLPTPPLHPNCRCQIALWKTETWGTRLPQALEREARRSIIKGWALPSESDAQRLRAADKLLRKNPGLPPTVEERARRAVRGRRPFKRPVP